ncbi:MAG: ethanolamine ammonia-lyase reactivating factor EutA [Oscillospiraceae bacterium]|nr:ethanolamine ammonia-lyase reactivating factor EutA [Oscillospiraceae bacterium]
MAEELLSVGLDVGTTTTQFILSRLFVENTAGGFQIPQMQITERQLLAKSPVHFTPLLGSQQVDGQGVLSLLQDFYKTAGITPEQVDTGAAIITGETSRKENAAAVLQAVSHMAGDFVSATAGPMLESILAAKGAGAFGYSKDTGKRVLHMDIGGGTSNLALIENGELVQTGCMNVGGRLLKFDSTGAVTYVSPVLEGIPVQEPEAVACTLTQALEMAAGLRTSTGLLKQLWTKEAGAVWQIPEAPLVISFSGGVADCIDKPHPEREFGDLGVYLGREIRKSRLCDGEYRLGQETIRATVIGAGCHSASLSGSTVFVKNISLPCKGLPVAVCTRQEQESENLAKIILQKHRELDTPEQFVICLPGYENPTYAQIKTLAERLAQANLPVYFLCLQADMGKAVGQALCLQLPHTPILSMDGLTLSAGSFLDVGRQVGPAIPVVIKTLVFHP